MRPGRSLRYRARLARRAARRAAQAVRCHRISFEGVPVLFANSFPKSGTHLLTQVLQSFPRLGPAVESGLPAVVTYEGDSGRERSIKEILGDLHRLLPGDIAYGHVHAHPEVVELLIRAGYCTYFILRDPRDVVVSHVHYVTEMEPNHIHHRYYTQELPDFGERLRTSILGLPGSEIPFPDIRARFEPYLEWLNHPQVLSLRFEDFMLDRKGSLGKVFDHAIERGFPSQCTREEAVRILAEGIYPERSPTFRSGKVGGWQGQFTQEHKRLFKDVTGDLLIKLGYERNQDW